MITVNIWRPLGPYVGHASASISQGGGDTYISWWPSPDEFWIDIATGTPRTRSYDDTAEGRPPDVTRSIQGLNESAAIRWWESFKSGDRCLDGHYQALTLNCSWAVISALKAAGGDERVSFITRNNIPETIYSLPQNLANPINVIVGPTARAAFNVFMGQSGASLLGLMDETTFVWTPTDCLAYANACVISG